VEGPLPAGSEAAADDLLDALLLAGTGGGRGVLENLFSFLRQAAGGDEASEGVGTRSSDTWTTVPPPDPIAKPSHVTHPSN
jgi:hypothetical protein